MPRVTGPLFSVEAHGSLANVLTYRRRPGYAQVIKMPKHKDAQSLAQQYQRWLYEDYVYLWNKQTEATKEEYRLLGIPKHRTAFQEWMSYHLTNLPDIAGWWHLDEKAGAIAYDSSKNRNNGIIYGASPTDGVIDAAFYFDGLNDYLSVPDSDVWDFGTGDFSLEAWVKSLSNSTGDYRFIITRDNTPFYYILNQQKTTGVLEYYGYNAKPNIVGKTKIADDTWHHVASVRSSGRTRIYVDGIEEASALDPGNTSGSNVALRIGRAYHGTTYPFMGTIDEVRIYNRGLDATEIKRHSKRRYPPQ